MDVCLYQFYVVKPYKQTNNRQGYKRLGIVSTFMMRFRLLFFCVLPMTYVSGLLLPGRRMLTMSTMSVSRKTSAPSFSDKKYPISRKYYGQYVNRIQNMTSPGSGPNTGPNPSGGYHVDFDDDDDYDEEDDDYDAEEPRQGGLRIIINANGYGFNFNEDGEPEKEQRDRDVRQKRRGMPDSVPKKSEHFEVVRDHPLKFADIGGYDNVKQELMQCVDMIKNYQKYEPYNVRIPKGLIFEGPPGTGKTMMAKALAGEANTGFISVAGSEFQEKYVGVGPARVRELFALAKNNRPCIVFIDEIDAVGRSRSSDGDSGTERDNTLNELLVALDGFKTANGVFLVGATNRIDLLDQALIRPGRIDKRVHIGFPDEKTRRAIVDIHIRGKPASESISKETLVELTAGFSGAQIENMLNEAMLNALRENRTQMATGDVDLIMNKMLAGWQPTDHTFTPEMIRQISIHEMGHSIMGLLSKYHAKMRKVIINLSSPSSPAYTIFESPPSSAISTREALFEHLVILLAGRVAEEIFFDDSVSTGAINDFEEALKLAERMITYYGMGKLAVYPSRSEKYRQIIDEEVAQLLEKAYAYAKNALLSAKEWIVAGAEILQRDRALNATALLDCRPKPNELPKE